MCPLLTNKNKILGMNARNLKFIRPVNKKSAVKLANDKLRSKRALQDAGLPITDVYGIIQNRKQLLTFKWMDLPASFVLKPNLGLGGEGILIIFGRKKPGVWIASGKKEIYVKNLLNHSSNILDGNFSLSGIPDIAFFEERLKLHPDFKKIAWQGIPDIRVIVYNNVPVMAMLRLPTQQSQGKANLHQGGIGAGIDMATGKCTYATQNDKLITHHPDTNTAIKNFTVPDWDKILKIAVSASQVIDLGYSGIDIVVDRDKGPVILEVNAHPGLSIQNANLTPLKDRLQRVSGLDIKTPAKGIKVAKELFANQPDIEITEDQEEEKKVLGIIEPVTVPLADDKKQEVRAKIDTGFASTTINRDLAIKLGFKNVIQNFDQLIDQENIKAAHIKEAEEKANNKNKSRISGIISVVGVKKEDAYVLRPKIKLTFVLKNQTITTEVAIARASEISYPMIIGRRDLKNFLIDPSKTLTK